MDLQILDLIFRFIQIAVLPLVGFLLKRIYDLEKRLSKAETCLDKVPSEDALHELALSIRAFGGDLKVVVEKIDGLGRIVDRVDRVVSRHEDYLLNGKGGK